jgi:hypothetical protein
MRRVPTDRTQQVPSKCAGYLGVEGEVCCVRSREEEEEEEEREKP